MGKEGADNANLVVGVHGLVRELRAYAGTRGVLVVDEPGEVTVVDRVTLDDLETAKRHLDAFVPRYARAILPALVAFTAWVREMGALDAPLVSVQNAIRATVNAVPEEDLAAAEIDPATAATDLGDAILVAVAGAIRDDARSKAPPLEWRSIALAKVNAARAAELGQASRLLDLLWRAITSPVLFGARLDDRGGERAASVVSINDDFLLALRHEGPVVVLDANAALHAPAITRVLGYAPKLVEIAVADGAPIERTIFATGNATRSSWLPRGVPDWEAGILAALRAAVGWMTRDVATRKVGFIAPLVIETAVAATLRPDDAKIRARWPHSKKALDAARALLAPILAGFSGEFLTGHYGALEGLDFMAGCDATVTFMDPRPNLGDEELRAEFLGLDPSGRLDQLAAAELQQAHGRLRTIHRTRPGRQLHVGAVVPAGWAGLDVHVEGLRVGRPRNVAAMSPEEFRAAREAAGLSQSAFASSIEQFARSIRCSVSKVKHYEQGRAPVPEDVARAVRAIMSDGSETPREKVS
jgi:DNA-binding transcriptional regulator YiaG